MTPRRIPVTIVTGFLGSGKTTLLSNLLGETNQQRLALLVNEFGEASIDGALLRDHKRFGHTEIHDLPNGLVAYSEDEDFLPVMREILTRRQLIDHVLIETSGLALPTAVMERLQGEDLKDHFLLDATLAVVDTPLLLAEGFSRSGHAESDFSPQANQSVASLFEQQLENADIVVLNKIDLLNDADLLEAETQVRVLAPGVRFVELAHKARLNKQLTLGLRLHEAMISHGPRYAPIHGIPGISLQPLPDHSGLNGHTHSGLGAHVHGLATHKHFHEQDSGWQSFMVRSKDPQDVALLRRAVIEVAKTEPLLRVKGFVAPKECGPRWLIQGVRTRIEAQPQLTENTLSQSQLVFIGYHPSRPKTVALLSNITGTAWR
ncbi:MAG: CobW family GTP-binding protein [Burkholderiales bacterium]|nr:GTP-binding protein [Ferrovum sp.]